MKYYVAPTIYTAEDVRILAVRVISESGTRANTVVVDSEKAGTFHTNPEYLHDTIKEAQKFLIARVLEFKSNLDYCLSKAIEGTDG